MSVYPVPLCRGWKMIRTARPDRSQPVRCCRSTARTIWAITPQMQLAVRRMFAGREGSAFVHRQFHALEQKYQTARRAKS